VERNSLHTQGKNLGYDDKIKVYITRVSLWYKVLRIQTTNSKGNRSLGFGSPPVGGGRLVDCHTSHFKKGIARQRVQKKSGASTPTEKEVKYSVSEFVGGKG